MDIPSVRVVVPSVDGIKTGQGTKVFINGTEFHDLCDISYKTDIKIDDLIMSKIELTFYGEILVERASGG